MNILVYQDSLLFIAIYHTYIKHRESHPEQQNAPT